MFLFPRKSTEPSSGSSTSGKAGSTGAASRSSDRPVPPRSRSPRSTASSSSASRPDETMDIAPDEHPLADYMSAALLATSPRDIPRSARQALQALASQQQQQQNAMPQSARQPATRHFDPGTTPPAAAVPDPQTKVPTMASNAAASSNSSGGGGGRGQHEIVMDFGDVYTGEVAKHPQRGILVPHGHGTLQSARGRHCYVGGFVNQQREGWGKLVTAGYGMWSAWKENRPDLTVSVRIDYPDGSKYSGYVEALVSPTPTTAEPVSRFTLYIMSVSFIKSGWGELIYPDGKRYFGQWQHDLPTNFGCQLTADGDRFTGMWRKGVQHGNGVLFTKAGLVYDGVWVDGKFHCAGGEVVFPGHVKLRGDWDDNLHFKNATVVLPEKRAVEKKYRITSLFDPLLGGASDAVRKKAVASAAPLKHALEAASTVEEVERAIVEHLKVNDAYLNCLKIVRRCFYFFYGTCGSDQLRGSGQRNSKLGWCYLRRSFGGCIHRPGGDPITEAMANDALGDILSFVASAYQWFMSLLGDSWDIVSDLDAAAFVSKRILDSVLTLVYPPLFNLYKQASSKDQLELDSALQRLGDITMDDVGVSFARTAALDRLGLFVPYASAMNTLRRMSTATTLTSMLNTLVRWTVDIDDETRMNQIRLQSDDAMVRVMEFYEKRRIAQRDDPDAEIPFADGIDGPERHGIASALNIVGGSLDDLFPIHQYVLMKANVTDLVAHSRLVGDFADVEWLLDATSRESFCVTNFKACVAVVSEMHPAIRDQNLVIVPSSSILRKVDDASEILLGSARTALIASRAALYVGSLLDWLAECSCPAVAVASPPAEEDQVVDADGVEADGSTTTLVVTLPCEALLESTDNAEPWWSTMQRSLVMTPAEHFSLLSCIARFATATNLHLCVVQRADLSVELSESPPYTTVALPSDALQSTEDFVDDAVNGQSTEPVSVVLLHRCTLRRNTRELLLAAAGVAAVAGIA